jgi:hypothetical protein
MTGACLLLSMALAHAAVPATLNYQGFLTNPTTGAPLTTPGSAPLSVTFKLWDALTSGNLIYAESQLVTVANGSFNVQIGTGSVQAPPNLAFTGVAFDKPYWLEVTVGAEILTPRQPLASSATTLRARVADSLAAVPGTGTGNTALGAGSLSVNNTGYDNTATGDSALYGNTTGYNNTANGYGTLALNTTGNFNTASGALALYYNTTGYENAANGAGALSSNSNGFDNTAVGAYALYGNTIGYYDTASGARALYFNTTGHDNTANGYISLNSNTTGNYNTASGSTALSRNTTGSSNTATGSFALSANTTGYSNTASGSSALSSNTTGYYNTANGSNVLSANITGHDNTANGSSALTFNTTGSNNTASGSFSLVSNTIGDKNTANGMGALQANTTAGSNVAVGYNALALQSFNNAGAAWDSGNTAVGSQALYSNQPTAIYRGISNTAAGDRSLYSNTDGSFNTAIGVRALYSNTTGYFNTASGNGALLSNTTGASNTASGEDALSANTTGGFNTASGEAALFRNTTGDNNTASGEGALSANTTGSNNIALGYIAGLNLTTGNNNIDIGNVGVAGESSIIRIGTPGTHTAAYLAGAVSASTASFASAVTGSWTSPVLYVENSNAGAGTSPALRVVANGTAADGALSVSNQGSGLIARFGNFSGWVAQLDLNGNWSATSFVSTSDRNAKQNFQSIDAREILDKVAALPITRWNFRSDVATQHLGPMAQDFYAAFTVGPDDKHIANVDESGVALAAIQGLNAKLESALREKDVQLQSQAGQLQAQVEKIAALEKDRLLQTARMEALEQQAARMVHVLSRLDKPLMLSALRQ